MNKLRLLPVFVFALLVVLVSSCKKDKDPVNGGTGNTDLQVYVIKNADGAYIQGASVTLYNSSSDRDAGKNVVNSGVTGSNGFVYFSELTPSRYYVRVVKKFGDAGTVTKDSDTGVPIKQYEQSALTVSVSEPQ